MEADNGLAGTPASEDKVRCPSGALTQCLHAERTDWRCVLVNQVIFNALNLHILS